MESERGKFSTVWSWQSGSRLWRNSPRVFLPPPLLTPCHAEGHQERTQDAVPRNATPQAAKLWTCLCVEEFDNADRHHPSESARLSQARDARASPTFPMTTQRRVLSLQSQRPPSFPNAFLLRPLYRSPDLAVRCTALSPRESERTEGDSLPDATAMWRRSLIFLGVSCQRSGLLLEWFLRALPGRANGGQDPFRHQTLPCTLQRSSAIQDV